MKSFKLPRKLKKKLKKGLWLYPPDEKTGGSLMAFPYRHKNDFLAYRKGELRNLFDRHNSRKRQSEFKAKYNKEVHVSDEELKRYIDDIMRKDLRNCSFEILCKAKNSKNAIIAYYNFVNAYQLFENGDESSGNICCMAVDRAKELMKK